VVGLPLRTHRRLKPQFEEWVRSLAPALNVRALPSLAENVPQIGPAEINAIRRNASEGYVHIAVVPCRDQGQVRREFLFDCRVAILDLPSDPLGMPWEAMLSGLTRFMEFEERWSQSIAPRDLHHPLLLPPPSFGPEREVQNYWKTCDTYRDTSTLTTANNTLQRVRALHRRMLSGLGSFWLDCRRLRFRIDPTRHGRTPDERQGIQRHRFCFPVPLGFHFDVEHEDSGVFTIRDQVGVIHTLRHANVDPWGSLRGK